MLLLAAATACDTGAAADPADPGGSGTGTGPTIGVGTSTPGGGAVVGAAGGEAAAGRRAVEGKAGVAHDCRQVKWDPMVTPPSVGRSAESGLRMDASLRAVFAGRLMRG